MRFRLTAIGYLRLIHAGRQTPQQALDTAAAATRQAHEAAAVPRWGPVAAGVLTALAMLLIETVIEDNLSLVVRAILVVAGIAIIVANFKVLWWMRDLRRARGVVPREPSPWKDEAVWWPRSSSCRARSG
ncbi:hypothetical protein FOH10_25655 [Nocardia otitidiscaviarum]|uniref:Uncharacterized protein n=1 Tax=Nocardia otitidiscaviarum TaxID=1823 RepID=A0A516NRT1_9NOCA|nr:hypothetical protein [Nocardia otitidiscaviarum]MCP9620810.1 hypothetical protein [Nocardia otitidiscaviarum]QDP81603.1 hypothetical protein FOH10_25655 [Nocardia otitidiscaviarum]